MLTSESLMQLQDLLAEENIDGWLLFDFKGRNPIAAAVLGDGIVGTRRVFVLIPRRGVPIALVHEIDSELWSDWPAAWKKLIWVYQEELEQDLALHIKGLRLAVDYSPRGASPYLDCIPAGVFDLLSKFALDTVTSAALVTRFLSVWTQDERKAHERAALKVAEVAHHAMRRVAECAHGPSPISEYDLCQWIRQSFDRAGLVTESGPSVSVGPNSARNHYVAVPNNSAALVPGQLLLIDLWAKEVGGLYADQTWMAGIGPASNRDAHLWAVVRDARDAALAMLKDRVRRRAPVTGAEVDLAARQVITTAGLESRVAGRTGHSIDRFGIHGFGPPIDGTETLDRRLLVAGVGFSVEPGIYLKGETGVRSEVNVYLTETDVFVTPCEYQTDLIIL